MAEGKVEEEISGINQSSVKMLEYIDQLKGTVCRITDEALRLKERAEIAGKLATYLKRVMLSSRMEDTDTAWEILEEYEALK